ncbi:cytochrome P450, family 51 (sterol 14-demethylase) [Cryptococcus neoformans]|nr:cytochrome P450, family 51 (sterol 14-demethylase) [Cryptococcus neoformans var. grubii]
MSAIISQVQQLLGQVAQFIPPWFAALPTSVKVVIAVIGIPALVIGLNVFQQLHSDAL